MPVFVWAILSFIVGLLISDIIFFAHGTTGTLRIDRRSPEKDLYRFELDKFEDLEKKDYIILKIDKNADLSHD